MTIELHPGESIPLGEGFTLKFLGIRNRSAEFALLRLHDPACLPIRETLAEEQKKRALLRALKLFPKEQPGAQPRF